MSRGDDPRKEDVRAEGDKFLQQRLKDARTQLGDPVARLRGKLDTCGMPREVRTQLQPEILVVVSSLVQFLFSARLSFFRRLITPTVGGTVIMLIAVNLFPITTNMLAEVPPGGDPASLSRPLVAFTAFVTIVLVSLYADGAARLGAPLFGIVAGPSSPPRPGC